MRAAAAEIGATIYIGAQLLQEAPASWWNQTDKNWNTGVFQMAADDPDFYIIHSYYTPYATNSNAADILATASTVTTDMMNYVSSSMTTAGVTNKPVALTEWNIFAEGSKQQVSFVNAMHAAIVLGELIRNEYGQATRWDLANGYGGGNDHGTFSQGDEPDNSVKWTPRPVFYSMYYFQKYFGDHMVGSTVTGSSDVLAYASKFESGQSGIVVINKGTNEQTASINIQNFGYGSRYFVYTLTGGTDNGGFSRKVFVNGHGPTLASGGPSNVETIKANGMLISDGVRITAPPRSISYVLIESGEDVITSAGSELQDNIVVYPNPSPGFFRVVLPSGGCSRIRLSDISGKNIFEVELDKGQTSVDVKTNSTSGIFILHIEKDGKIYHKKVELK